MKAIKWIILLLFTTILVGCSDTGDNVKEQPKEEQEQKDSQIEESDKENNDTNTSQENETEQEQAENPQQNDLDKLLLPKEFFNQTEIVNGKEVITNVDNLLILVNKQSAALPADYEPEDLVRPNVRFVFGNEDVEKAYMKQEAAQALEEMFNQAEKEGIYLFAISGYRSYNRQTAVYQNAVNNQGEEAAQEVVAIPGQSEHQTGLAMDISSESNSWALTEDFENTPEGQWLKENAHHFGFILRYPKGKEHITGYAFEPWHFRYVGKEYAQIMYENDWTLEEFFEEAEAI